MGKSMRMGSAALTICVVLCVIGWAAPASAGGPLVFDKETGHYKDLSYEALSDEGLSWEQRTRLFGGQTVHYGELTDAQRKVKEKELADLLKKIDMKLVNGCEADIRKWLDERAARPLKNADWRKDWTMMTRGSMGPLSCGVATLLRAYEIFGDQKYLKAGLERAEVFLRDQTPRGNWRQNKANDGRYCRIQDGNQHLPFFAVLHAYKMTGDKKYFESAKRCADLLLGLQRSSGGWPDQWLFDGAPKRSSGIIHGMSHNDNATISPFMMMVTMYHMTKDRKYIANLHKLGPFIAKTNLGEGDVVGWAEGYDDNGRPLRVRRYELELPYSKTLCRSVGFLLTWLYLMDGSEAHMDLLKRAYAWHEKVRQKELESWQLEAWELLRKSHAKAGNPWFYYRPGFADAWLPDGSNWGYVIDWKMYAWYPTTEAMIKKSGKYVGGASLIHPQAHVGHLKKWADAIRAGGSHPGFSRSFVQNSAGNTLSQVRRTLLEYKRGGREGLLQYYTNPVKYTPDQYLQARVDAAKRALDERNVRLAAMHEKGIRTRADCGHLCAAKARWYGPKHTKWGAAYEDVIMREQYPGSTAWHQWQLVYDAMLARGKIPAEAAARGGRGMEATHTHLDSWDVLGQYDMHVFEVENHFDVPIGKTPASAPGPRRDRVVHVKVRADSEHPGSEAFKAMDGNPGTMWHSRWRAATTDLPHEIVVDMGARYAISGFTYLPRTDASRNGTIKDYEVYLSDKNEVLLPLANGKPIGKPVARGTFAKSKGENVVTFPAPVKGRYFRLRALSEVNGAPSWAGIAELRLHCEGVKFVGKPWSLRVDFPEAGDAITLIEGFPLLNNLLELEDPWSWDPIKLKDQILPGEMSPFPGSEENPVVFVNRRTAHDWRTMSWEEAHEKRPADRPGLKVWNRRAYETDYYALDSARPFIRLHLGRPMLAWVDKMKVLFPELPQSARKELPAKMDRIVEALKPYGARKLPRAHKSHRYLLPGGTRMTISDYTVDAWAGRYGDGNFDDVRIKIDFEPAKPPKGREPPPLLVPWRVAVRRQEGRDLPPGVMAHLQQSEPGRAGSAAGRTPASGKTAPRQWSDRPDGFASVDAMGQNGTTGGAGGKTVTVTNQADLEEYAQKKEPYVIRVKGAIKITPKPDPKTRYEKLTPREIHVASDKTIIGVGKSGQIVGGGFFLGPGVHNVILRNLTIRDTYVKGDWAGLTQDDDGLQMDGAHHVWVDHCHFSRHGDGCLDSRAGTTYLTVSWCIFSHHNKTFGVGWDSKVTAQITLHHSWFRNTGCRSPAAGQVLRAHYYNNYLQNIGTCSHRALIGTNLIVQNSLFENVNNPHRRSDATTTLVATGNVYRNTRGSRDTCGPAFFDPGRFYAYALDKAEDLPGILAKYAGPQENIGQ